MNINHMTDYTKEECITCGVAFYMPSILWRHKKDYKESFFCPNGHSMAYTKGKVDILADQLVQKEREISQLNQKLRDASKPKRRRSRKAWGENLKK
jgi:hypothetical protein